MASVGRALCATSVVLAIGAGASSAFAETTPARDPQETNPNVGLFRLPAHRGSADALAGPEGFGFLSKDNDFGMMLHPVLQGDARYQVGTLLSDADRSKFVVAFAGLALTARFYERHHLLPSVDGAVVPGRDRDRRQVPSRSLKGGEA
jgi:hypothetical protein